VNLLDRSISRVNAPGFLSSAHVQIDALCKGFVAEAGDGKVLASLLLGGLAYRLGKLGSLAVLPKASHFLLSPMLALLAEVSVYRKSLSLFEKNPSSASLFSREWKDDLLFFGLMKVSGQALPQPLLLRHFLQDGLAVLEHHASHALGWAPAPQGVWLEQFVQAEASILRIGAVSSLARFGAGGAWERLEKSLELRSESLSIPLARNWRGSASRLLRYASEEEGTESASSGLEKGGIASIEEPASEAALEKGPKETPPKTAPRAHNPLVLYRQGILRKAVNYPSLSADEEASLIKQLQEQGCSDQALMARVVNPHLLAVYKVASQFQAPPDFILEMIATGNEAVVDSVRRYDPSRGTRFENYAIKRAKGHMRTLFLERGGVRLTTRGQRYVFWRMTEAQADLTSQHIAPSAENLAAYFNEKLAERKLHKAGRAASPEAIEEVLSKSRNLVSAKLVDEIKKMRAALFEASLDERLDDEGNFTLLDLLASAEPSKDMKLEVLERDERVRRMLPRFLGTLDRRERKIFVDLFMKPLLDDAPEDKATLKALGKRFGVSGARVGQLSDRVRDKFREFFAAENPLRAGTLEADQADHELDEATGFTRMFESRPQAAEASFRQALSDFIPSRSHPFVLHVEEAEPFRQMEEESYMDFRRYLEERLSPAEMRDLNKLGGIPSRRSPVFYVHLARMLAAKRSALMHMGLKPSKSWKMLEVLGDSLQWKGEDPQPLENGKTHTRTVMGSQWALAVSSSASEDFEMEIDQKPDVALRRAVQRLIQRNSQTGRALAESEVDLRQRMGIEYYLAGEAAREILEIIGKTSAAGPMQIPLSVYPVDGAHLALASLPWRR